MGWSIRKKLIIFLMVATIFPFGAAIIITYYQTTDSLNQHFVSTTHDVIEDGKEDISTYLQDLAYMTTTIYRYTPLMNALRDGVSNDIVKNQEEVKRILVYLFNTRPEIEQMHLYIHKGKDSYAIYHSTLSERGKYDNVNSHPYYFQLSQSTNFTVIEPPHEIYSYNNLSLIPNSQKKDVLSFHNVIRDIPSDHPLAFLSIDINLSKLSAIADRLYLKETEDFYLINEEGLIVYSSEEKLIGTENKQQWFQQVKRTSESSKSMGWKDTDFSGIIVYEKFTDSFKDWYIVKRIPYDSLYQGARETVLTNILVGLISLVIVLFATLVISFKFTAPIKVLIANMKQVEQGKFQANFDSLGNDEFGMLGRHFKLMLAKINDLIQRKYKLEVENKSSQLRVLQSQVNPHFLYNALQSIGTLALKHKAVPVYSLLTALSKIMRYSMNMKEDIVPLTAEIQHVTSYLTLQKQRFDERFEFELKIQKEVEDIHVPKMILQPLVENCFKHGFDQQEGKSIIQIEAYLQQNDSIYLTVKDNGKGATSEELRDIQKELFEGIREDGMQREAIGLKNIYDRLQIYYSNQVKMSVNSNEDSGFTVTIVMPKEMSKEVNPS
ncbi:sensor histidine kinase [Metabacillus litoralis]|jgi:two-component system, sensor histidine kinase YesM|uniref:sensor histidine kinase n=1 Tax=Metabacillus litoralis TaxID=152268 RepID=UPI0020407897|nr:sensor histidine kinase [Metabacillus litoralis]MCM3655248.1 sensor histidine kinase [Metabacillus litoralis]